MATCTISSSNVLSVSGVLAVRARLTITPVSVAGIVMATKPTTVTVINGIVSFPCERGTTVNIRGDILGYNSASGTNVLIPSTATATLEGLTSVASVPTSGLTIKDEGTALAGLFGTLNFVGAGVAATDSAGIATITITSSGAAWGQITGTFSTQTDLQTALNAKQTLDATLTALAGVTVAADQVIYATGADAFTVTSLTSFGRSLIDDADATAGRSTLGLGNVENTALSTWAGSANITTLGTIAAGSIPNTLITGLGTLSTQAASAVAITGGTIAGLTGLAIRSTGSGAFDLTFANAENLTAGKTLTFALGDTSRTLTIGASASVSGSNTGDQTSVSGNAGTATALATARAINGVAFDGTANITVTAAAGTLSGATLAAGVTASSLTSFGASIALGTPGSGVLTSCTGLPPVTGIVGWPANASGVLTNDGAGVLSWGAGGGGSQTPWTSAIDGDGFNLEDVGSLIPRAGSILGSAALPWLESFTGSTTQYESVVSSAGLITHAALGSATNIGIAFTSKGTGAYLLANSTSVTNGVLQFGGATSSFPALARVGTLLEVILADGSDFAPFKANRLDLTGIGTGATSAIAIPSSGRINWASAGQLYISSGTYFFTNSADSAFLPIAASQVVLNNVTKILQGAGTPESAVTAPVGSMFLRSDGGANTTLYVKESGAGNTGWIAK